MTTPVTAQALKLEVGKAYRTRDGRKVTARWKLDGQFAMFEDGMDEGAFCREDGQPSYSGFARWGIVAEWDVPDPDGWIQWSGGKCPVPPETVVECRGRKGHVWEIDAGSLYWNHPGYAADIIAYRVVKPATIAEPAPAPTRDFSAHFGPLANLTWRDAFVLDALRQHSCALSCILAAVEPRT
ncbi:hypothetical protein J8F10_09310 [Gemmata sp. G18]|uniref:Uncharacterized protein n=1 Tax=Gemmata palustris TaxID=2822762 RepID=A0ABS5BP50_9BACT|nr:hypothetical protein [Gemmata palustris]MBP3955478.1 hypothetical protein [Gemmata palustris]